MGVNAATGATALIFSFCNLFGMNLNYKFEGSYLAFVLVSLQGSCLPIESCFTALVLLCRCLCCQVPLVAYFFVFSMPGAFPGSCCQTHLSLQSLTLLKSA